MSKEIDFYFQPFSGLEFQSDTPILCLVFENQPDMILTKVFPEIEATRSRLDQVNLRGNETVTIFNVFRNETIIPLAIIYIRQPWRRQRGKNQWNIDSINFYREVSERVSYAVHQLKSMKYTKAVFILPSRFQPANIRRDRLQEQRLEKFIRTITEAITAANYQFDEFKKNKNPDLETVTLTFFGTGDREVDGFFRRSINEGKILGKALEYVQRLVMLPPNAKYPARFVEEATGTSLNFKTAASKTWHGVKGHAFSSRTKITYLYGTEGIEKFGLGLIAGVGQGSVHQPVFLKAHYKPKNSRQKTVRKVVIVGKGVTFDTGGINLKLGSDLNRMHYDMASAATALGIIKLADSMNLPVEIIALMPLVENSIGPQALKPHDIIKAYDGRTVEIIDTDAEGRLIMADSIAYAEKNLKADCTITIGTLCNANDFGPDLMKVVVGNDRLKKRVTKAEWLSAEKMMLLPRVEHFNWVDNEHVGNVSDLVGEPAGIYYHVASFVFLYNFFMFQEPEWVFVDISAVFESDAADYGAGPGFGLKFVWYLTKQFV